MENLYLLKCGNSLSAWKAWQTRTFAEARRFENYLFTREWIIAFGHHLELFRQQLRNSQPITMPDFPRAEFLCIPPIISIGNGCSISFTQVAGYYGK